MKKSVLNLKMAVMALGIFISTAANAFTAVTSGNWSSAATWGGTAPGSLVTGNDIIIPAGITVTLDADVTFTGILNTFSVSGTLTNSTSNNLTITQGVLSGNGTISIRKIMFTNTATASFTGNMTVNEFLNSSLSLGFVAVANISDSLIIDAGSLILNTNSTLSMMANSTVRVSSGTFSLSGGTFGSSSNYNVLYTGTTKNAGVELNSANVQNITLNMNSNSESVNLNNNTTVNAALKVNKGMLNLNGKKLTIMGDLMMGAGATFTGTNASDLSVEGTGTLTSSLMFNTGTTLNSISIKRPSTTVKIGSNVSIFNNLSVMAGTCSIESGAMVTMNANSKVHIEDGMLAVNSGSFNGAATYNVEYMGTTTSTTTGGAELSGAGLNNVTVNYAGGTAIVSLNNAATIAGALNLTSGRISLNGQNLTLNGTMVQTTTATIIGNANSELNLNLASASNNTLYLDAASTAYLTLSKLKINIADATTLMLGSELMIKNELTFVKGKLMIDNTSLTVLSTGSVVGYDNTRYLITTGTGSGALKMNVASGASFMTFPIGTKNNYSPAYVQQTSAATTGNIMVKAMNDVYTSGTYGFLQNGLPIVGRTWFIEAETGVTVNMNIKLGWVAAAELNAFDRTNAMIRHYTNNAWDTYAAASATASVYGTFELQRSGLTSLSPFAVSDAGAALKIPEVSNAVEFEMYPNPAKEAVTLKLASGSYNYDITDITGRIVASNVKTDGLAKIDVSNYHAGCYFIKITNLADNASTTKRFIKN